MKIKPPNEKQITREIRQFLGINRIYCWKVWQGLGSKKGVADLIGLMPPKSKFPGRFLAIEVKTDHGKLSDYQDAFLKCIAASGGIAFVARSVKDVRDNLGEYW